MAYDHQPALFDEPLAAGGALADPAAGAAPGMGPGVGPLPPARSMRTALGSGAWVDHLPGWLSGSGVLFDLLLTTVEWRAERVTMYERELDVPRLVRWYGETEALPHPVLAGARDALSDHYADEPGAPFVTTGMCLYRDGRDSVAWHGDTIGRGAHSDTMVAILSVGTARPLRLRPRGGGPGRTFRLGHGDLLVMGGSCQRTWEHSVPKTAHASGPRISIQFRPAGVA